MGKPASVKSFSGTDIMRFLLILSLAFLTSGNLLAETGEKLPATGRLAGTTVGGYGHTGFEGGWGGYNIEGEDEAPITASINRISREDWELAVHNNTEDKYKVSLVVEQMDDRSRRLKQNPISVSLSAGESFTRVVRAHVLATHAAVNLRKWTRIEKQPTRAELESEIATKKEEIKNLEAQLANIQEGS